MIGLGVRTNKINVGGATSPPANTVAPTVSGTAVVGQTLTTTNGTWSNSPTSYTYQWYRGASAISGETNSTYVLVQADAGNTSNIKCVVTATNAGGSASADSNTVAQILTIRTNSFLTASGITDTTIKGALNTLDVGFISASIIPIAFYPMVGGVASTMKYNFMDARDLDSAYRLAWFGGWTYNSSGALPNGTNAYADTNLIPNNVLNVNSHSLFYYLNTNNTPIQSDPANMGIVNTLTQRMTLTSRLDFMGGALDGGAINISSQTTAAGFSLITKQSNTVTSVIKNSTKVATGNSGGTLCTNKLPIGNVSINGVMYSAGWTNNRFAAVGVANGLSDSESVMLYNLIQQFQTTLGRNV